MFDSDHTYHISSPVERGIKSETGPVGRSVFCHIKISSHHIHRWGGANNFLGLQSKAFLSSPAWELACIMDCMPLFLNHPPQLVQLKSLSHQPFFLYTYFHYE